jgi:hypothetical protein
MKWFRFYSEVLHDPKVQKMPPALRWHWVSLLCVANEHEPRGYLPRSLDDLAWTLRLEVDALEHILGDLVAQGLIDDTSKGYCMHNWSGRQHKSDDVTARVQKHRASNKEGGNVTETLHIPEDETPISDNEPIDLQGYVTLQKRSGNVLDTDTDTESDTDSEQNRAEGLGASAPPAKAKRKKPATRAPEEYNPSDKQLSWLKSNCPAVDADKETQKWLDHHRAKGTIFSDWDAGWRTWMSRSQEYAEQRGTSNGTKDRSIRETGGISRLRTAEHDPQAERLRKRTEAMERATGRKFT